MSEWRKIDWGDVRTMPANYARVECHRLLPGKVADDPMCVKVTGTSRWHQPLFSGRSSDIFSGTGHDPHVQVSLIHQQSETCEEDHPELTQDEAFGIRLDTMWWRELPEPTEILE